MVELENTIISDEIFKTKFICDLEKCKGGCCKEGDIGAPLTKDEIKHIKKILPIVLKFLPQKNVSLLKHKLFYNFDKEFENVTLCDEKGICIFGYENHLKQIECSFEKAYNKKKINFPKPISCHLFPIRITFNQKIKKYFLNFKPREKFCNPACIKGEKNQAPLFQFLKKALIRKFGNSYYTVLEKIYSIYYSK